MENLKCPLCDKTWKNNKSGAMTLHLKKVHSIETVELMIEKFPDYAQYFNVKKREKTESEGKVQCKLCGEWMKEVTRKHLESVHSLTSDQYREKFGRYSQYSEESLQKRREINKKRTQKMIEVRESNQIESECQYCHKKFFHKPSIDPKFCSRQCKNNSQKENTGYRIDINLDDIKRMYIDEKIPFYKIAQNMNVSKKTIFRRLKDANLILRRKGEEKSLFLQKHSEQNPFMFPESREKISQKNREYFAIKENREKVSNKIKEIWKNPEYRKNISDKASRKMLSRTPEQVYDQLMKQYATKKKNGTNLCNGLEKKYEELYLKDIPHEPQFIIPEGSVAYRYDFHLLGTNVLIEVNGTGTHADPRFYGPDDIIKLGLKRWIPRPAKEIWEYDKQKRLYAESLGYEVRVIWEKDL